MSECECELLNELLHVAISVNVNVLSNGKSPQTDQMGWINE